jgi:hypothetical protein
VLAVAVGWGWAAAADRAGAAPWLDAADAVVAGAVVAGAVAADAAWGAEVPLPLLVLLMLVLVLEFLLVLELPVLLVLALVSLVLAFVPLPLVLLLPVPPADPVVPAGPDPGAVLIVDALEPGWAALSGPVPEPGGPGPPLCGARDPLATGTAPADATGGEPAACSWPEVRGAGRT